MKFSIIIPVYNAESTIDKCVESIINQKINDIQIILIENGSIDNTWIKCQEIKKKYQGIELYRNDIKGVSAARNIGLAKANGDIIGFCDADDYYEGNAFRTIEDIFTKCNIEAVFGGSKYISSDYQMLRHVKNDMLISFGSAIEHVLCNPVIMGSVWGKFYKSELLKRVHFQEDLEYFEDGCFNVQILSEYPAKKVYISKNIIYNYIDNMNSVTRNIKNAFDKSDRFKYFNAVDYLYNSQCTTIKYRQIKEFKYRLSVENILYTPEIKSNAKYYNNLYNEVKSGFMYFFWRIWKFDCKYKIKLLYLGLNIILKGKQ